MKASTCIIKYANGKYAHKNGGLKSGCLYQTDGVLFHEVATYKNRESAESTLKGALSAARANLQLIESSNEAVFKRHQKEYEDDIKQLESVEIIDLQIEL